MIQTLKCYGLHPSFSKKRTRYLLTLHFQISVKKFMNVHAVVMIIVSFLIRCPKRHLEHEHVKLVILQNVKIHMFQRLSFIKVMSVSRALPHHFRQVQDAQFLLEKYRKSGHLSVFPNL